MVAKMSKNEEGTQLLAFHVHHHEMEKELLYKEYKIIIFPHKMEKKNFVVFVHKIILT